MVAVADTILRFSGKVRPEPVLERPGVDQEELSREIDVRVDSAVRGDVLSGADWDVVTELLCRRPYTVLSPKSTWAALAERLLVEMAVSDGVSWMLRAEAYQRLMAHPLGGPAAVATAANAADDTGVQSMVGLVSVFDSAVSREATAHVVRHLRHPRTDRAFAGALLACVRKVRDRHFGPAEMAEVGRVITDLLSGGRSHRLASSVAHLLPAHVRGRFGRRTWTAAVRCLGLEDNARRTVTRIVASARVGLPHDGGTLLPALVDEALNAPVFDERLYALFTLYSTPFRAPVARELATMLRHDRPDAATIASLLEALRVLGGPGERRVVESLLVSRALPSPVRDTAASALGHIAGTSSRAFWRAAIDVALRGLAEGLTSEISVLDRLVYALGMADDLVLLAEVASDARVPHNVRAAARWWHSIPDHIRQSARTVA